jgi:hypothetical protein
MYHYAEPLECIQLAAYRAASVIKLWSALKKSYAVGPGPASVQAIRSTVVIKEDISDSFKVGSGPMHYRVIVNGEPRSQWPIPKNKKEWRYLVNGLLGEYLREHIRDEVRVGIGIHYQNQDEEGREEEASPDWNLTPIWRIGSALTAYYVEFLMVMRRFRSCKVCGKDISHQKESAIYCGDTSTCRSTDFHRRKAARRRDSHPSPQ